MKFSMLMSVYAKDNPDFLREALLSILNQTKPIDQLVVVCDGPISIENDQILSDFAISFRRIDIPMDILKLKSNVGLGLALKEGVTICEHEYILRMDSDDVCHKERVNMTYDFISCNPNYDVYGAYILEFNSKLDDLNKKRIVPTDVSDLFRFSKRQNPMNHVTTCIKKNSLLQVGNYESVIYHEDYYLWVKFMNGGFKLINDNKIYVYVRVGNNLVDRRRGVNYIKHELTFLKKCLNLHHFSYFDMFVYLLIRIPVRFFPGFFVKKIYSWIRK